MFVDDLDRPRVAGEDAHHLERVLRLRPGEAVTAADGKGGWRVCTWTAGGLEPAGAVQHEPDPSPPVTVGFALTKGDRPEWTVQKLTEVGVDRILPFTAARSVVRLDAERAERQVHRWRRVVREAAMQCRRTRLPVVEPVATFGEALADLSGVALAEPGGRPASLATPAVLVGPEGGWSPEEREQAPATVGIGPTVLRGETAAVAAAVLLCALRAGGVQAAT